jgi:epoxyqueuosine reductase
MDPSSLASALKAEAGRLGFQLAGITSPAAPTHIGSYRDWLAAGRHGEMGYLATERAVSRRADPRTILPGCRSILVVGMNYAAGEGAREGGEGVVASYARGADYHDLIPQRLKALVSWLEAEVGEPIPHKIYTDTGPILERDLAQRAGLGWIGRNTCLIHPRLGSYYLLGEVFLGIPLPPDQPFTTDHCGTCTRCLDACPTQCILPDRTIDARRCISYLTIELKGPIPKDLRPAVDNWLFGCDVCQDVCPWNLRFSRPADEPALRPELRDRPAGAGDLFALDRAGFRRELRGSPLLRPHRRGILRNAAVVAGNRRDRTALPALRNALLHDEEPIVRQHAAWAIGRIAGPEAREALLEAAEMETAGPVQEEIREALAQLPGS